MKGVIKISALIFSTCLAGQIFAHNVSASIISLPGGGDLSPKASMKLSLNPLIHGASYNVQCNITNSNTDGIDMHFDAALNAEGSSTGQIYLNGKELNAAHQAKVAAGTNVYLVDNVISMGKSNDLIFQNLDLDNKISVSDCQATPVTSSR